MIPKSLQANLPFESKPKHFLPTRKKPLLEERRQKGVVMEPRERKIRALVQHLQLMKSEKVCGNFSFYRLACEKCMSWK